MFENRYLDQFTQSVVLETENFSDLAKERIIYKTISKINATSYKKRLRIKVAVAACFVLLILSGFIPSTPIHAFVQNVFQLIPGLGIIQNEENQRISLATTKAYKEESEGAFLEIKYAYVMNKVLQINAVTNIGYSEMDFTNKEEMLKKAAGEGETPLRLYLLSGSKKIYLQNYTVAGPSMETGAMKFTGSLPLNEDLLQQTSLIIGFDHFEKQIQLNLENVEEGLYPDTMGSCLMIDDLLVFADLQRSGNLAVLNLSSVHPKQTRNLRFDPFDFEKEMFSSSIQMIDSEGTIYYPNDQLREENNDSENSFYFEIPSDQAGLKVVIPQIFYDTWGIGDIKVPMPRLNETIAVNEKFECETTKIVFEGLTLLPKDNEVVSSEFGEDTLKLDFSAQGQNSMVKVLRVMPEIKVKDGFEYYGTSSHGYAALWDAELQEGSYYTVFDKMEEVSKILVEIETENVMVGPFEIEIKD